MGIKSILSSIRSLQYTRKSRISILLITIAIGVLFALFINISYLREILSKYQNTERERDIEFISKMLYQYIQDKNTCPTTSFPQNGLFLPELIIVNGTLRGGVPVRSIEDVESYISPEYMIDPYDEPYMVGTLDSYVTIYTNNYITFQDTKSLYKKSLDTISCSRIVK